VDRSINDDIGLLQKPCRTWLPRPPSSWASRCNKPSSTEVAEVAKKLPVGQLYATGRAFVPHVRQSLYSDVIVALAGEPQ
jgi:hypothetical protein